jgi:hypothetical protein
MTSIESENELTFSEKRQVALVDWLLSEPDLEYQEFDKAENLERENFKLTQSIKEGYEIINNLTTRITQLHTRIYQLEQENKRLKSSQLEAKPEPKSDKKPMAKKPKFKLPENFADYQQECDDLINALSCFYNIKKGKWGKDILQFILTPNDTEKAKHPYPDKWKAGLYFSRRWAVDKVNLSDPDEWSDWYMDIYDFADANDLEIS